MILLIVDIQRLIILENYKKRDISEVVRQELSNNL